jgi:hypothetical protein
MHLGRSFQAISKTCLSFCLSVCLSVCSCVSAFLRVNVFLSPARSSKRCACVSSCKWPIMENTTGLYTHISYIFTHVEHTSTHFLHIHTCATHINTFLTYSHMCNTHHYRYEGQMLNGKYHGYGRLEYADGRRYDGEWCQGVRRVCMHVCMYVCVYVCVSVCVCAHTHTHKFIFTCMYMFVYGRLEYADGRQYDGEWCQGVSHVCMYVCIHTYTYIYTYTHAFM